MPAPSNSARVIRPRRHPVALGLLLISTLACSTLVPSPGATLEPGVGATATRSAGATEPPPTERPLLAGDVRRCNFVPGESVAALMPPEVAEATPEPHAAPGERPDNTAVDADLTAEQLDLSNLLADDIENEYVDPELNGVDWPTLRDEYETLIEGGLTDEDFYLALNLLLYDLGDDHSFFQSPEEVAEAEASYAGNADFVGIGVAVELIPIEGSIVILYVYPGGAAEEAGLRSHDSILAVDGTPILDENGEMRDLIPGEVDTDLVLTVAHPGGEPFDLTLTRRRITGATPVDYCLMPDEHIGYIFLPHLDDETIPDQVYAALDAMTLEYPLEGLIIDNRVNAGGRLIVMYDLLALFTSGLKGTIVGRHENHTLDIEPNDRAGSQEVPLVVLVAPATNSAGEVMSGVLLDSGRATVIGQTTQGNVETIEIFDYPNGSRAWIATSTYQYPLQTPGLWEETGIIPDLFAPVRWDLFTESDDPALAAAMTVFGVGQ